MFLNLKHVQEFLHFSAISFSNIPSKDIRKKSSNTEATGWQPKAAKLCQIDFQFQRSKFLKTIFVKLLPQIF